MTVTEEELQRIVARAVKVALGEIVGDRQEQPIEKPAAAPVEVKPFGEEELDDAMRFMASNRGKADELEL